MYIINVLQNYIHINYYYTQLLKIYKQPRKEKSLKKSLKIKKLIKKLNKHKQKIQQLQIDNKKLLDKEKLPSLNPVKGAGYIIYLDPS